MIIKKIGKYKLTKDFTVCGGSFIKTLVKGTVININQIDTKYNKVISPSFGDWVGNEIHAKKEKINEK